MRLFIYLSPLRITAAEIDPTDRSFDGLHHRLERPSYAPFVGVLPLKEVKSELGFLSDQIYLLPDIHSDHRD